MKKKRYFPLLVCCGVVLVLLACFFAVKPRIKSRSANSFSGDAIENPRNTLPINPALSAEATVRVEGKDVDLKVNSIGAFPRVVVPAEATIPIQLALAPNAAVHLVALDGGIFEGKANTEALMTDSHGKLDFRYQIRKEPGNYRVAVSYQGQRLTFNFWVGPELTPRVSR